MDITETLAPKSDQMDAVDLLSGARTFTIDEVTRGNAEQPVQIRLQEFPRPWRPGKSMRRVLAACWGADASQWHGRRVRLFCDPRVKFGGEEVGGIRIAALSHIDGAKKVPLLVTRGRSAIFTVEPLTDETITRRSIEFAVTDEQIAASTDRDELRSWWQAADEDGRALIQSRVGELDAGKEGR